MPIPKPDEWMTVKEIAAAFGVCPNTIRRRAAAKQFPQPYRISRRVYRWKRAEVEAFAEQCPRGIDSPSYQSSSK
ncbi:helix-turn-helix transcriptional regulator [Crateriforma conspicua]|uniref:helix-turn-helix transcriptional regulator n=1 Tax=Crateriforma conspicua TaxID=2527996 RepID=UPI001187D7D6|nr:helix-turn-helix domain-containing protein [Crateriforma conspicua]QDV66166.1 Helix-turn-helix domain protein [Crateriforma conspicua]